KQTLESKQLANTLLVLNVPPFVDQLSIRHLFRNCGKISDVMFNSKISLNNIRSTNKSHYLDKSEDINGYKVCFVVFTGPTGLQKALNLSKASDVLTLKPDSDQHMTGLKAMKQRYNESIVDSNELQEEINEFMAKHDKQVEEERLKAKQMDGIPDADGWIKVNRHSGKRHLPNNYSNDQKIIEKQNKLRKKSSNDLLDFYSFQQKESKINYLMNLRTRFEDDKKRIALMKSQRKFRPF
ncbi:unnamed protein product, partial [Medioppia subpectinata]